MFARPECSGFADRCLAEKPLRSGRLRLGVEPLAQTGVTAFAMEHGKFRVFDFQWELTQDTPQDYTFWAGLLGGAKCGRR